MPNPSTHEDSTINTIEHFIGKNKILKLLRNGGEIEESKGGLNGDGRRLDLGW